MTPVLFHGPAAPAAPVARFLEQRNAARRKQRALKARIRQAEERGKASIGGWETRAMELKSALVELHCANRALLSSNLELERHEKQLEAANHELRCVKQSLGARIGNVEKYSRFLETILDTSRVSMVFSDKDLNIRYSTPDIVDVFTMEPQDHVRSLRDAANAFKGENLVDTFLDGIASGRAVERVVSCANGKGHYLMRIVPCGGAGHVPDGGIMTFVNVTPLVASAERATLLAAELGHRVKNSLAIVASLAEQMARRSESVGEYCANFVDRVQGLAKTHDILSARGWRSVCLADLLSGELHAFTGEGERAVIQGPRIYLKPKAAAAAGMIFHELATNAVKYGALGCSGGTLRVAWEIQDDFLNLTWRESGGPRVQPPLKAGLGTGLIVRCIEYELGGEASIDYREEGIIATLRMPRSSQHFVQPGESNDWE